MSITSVNYDSNEINREVPPPVANQAWIEKQKAEYNENKEALMAEISQMQKELQELVNSAPNSEQLLKLQSKLNEIQELMSKNS